MDEQVAAFDDVLRLVLENPLRAGDPAGGNRPIAADIENHPDPEGTADGAETVAGAHPLLVAVLPGPHRRVGLTGQEGGGPEGQAVLGAELAG